MLSLGAGVGPFIVSVMTDLVGWRYSYYVSAVLYGVLLFGMFVLMPETPLQCKLMGNTERGMFVVKEQEEEKAMALAEDQVKYKVSYKSILGRTYVYMMCVWQIANLFIFYSDFIATPFFLDEFFSVDIKTLGYIQLAMSLTAFISSFGWKYLLSLYEIFEISWFKSRVFLMIMPPIVMGTLTVVIPFIGSLEGAVCCLIVNSIIRGSKFGGSIMTVTYELDPFNAPLIISIFNSVGQAMGFVCPLTMAAINNSDTSRVYSLEVSRTKWSYFYLMEGGIAFISAVSVVVALIIRKEEWRRHPVLEARYENGSVEHKGNREYDGQAAGDGSKDGTEYGIKDFTKDDKHNGIVIQNSHV